MGAEFSSVDLELPDPPFIVITAFPSSPGLPESL